MPGKSLELPSRGAARALSLDALAWLVADDARIGRFLSESGLDGGDLRQMAGSDALALAVFDHLLSDESLLIAFCADQRCDPTEPARARAALPGGDDPHWT